MYKSELFAKTAKVKAAQRTAANAIDDATALEAMVLYPMFKDLVAAKEKVNKGFRFQYADKLWRTEQPEYTFDGVYAPGPGTESLFSEVAKEGEGTRDNPIHYNNNMELVEGKYYEQGGIVYRCFRSTGVPVYNNLADLVGIYVVLADA